MLIKIHVLLKNCNLIRTVLVILLIASLDVAAQTSVNLADLSAFKDPGKSWRVAKAVTADITKPNVFAITPGSGLLVNVSDAKNHGKDLYTKAEYGDIDIEFDYLMAKGSNSGMYLQGMYEVQLEDTWSAKKFTFGNNGGIYERWNDDLPQGQKGYEGFAPRQNASRAPGLWQHMKISFQAPRFDASGKRMQPAKMLQIELNGVVIHENVELSGPTRGAMAKEEMKKGPVRIQGDHGTVAFRNINITEFESGRPEVKPSGRPVPYPIFVKASETPVFRSFMDLPDGQRVIHTVSVASGENVHYTYDMDTGMIIQVWRGGFLDATPMWHSRGDGSARPLGAVQRFGKPMPAIAKLASPQSPWQTDTTGTGFRPKGYSLDADDKPVFTYMTGGSVIKDASHALPGGEGITREITITNAKRNTYVRLAEGASIVEASKGMYVIDDNAYYLRLDDVGSAQPIVRDAGGKKELLIPVSGNLKYSILF
jgi:hypothetical protein